MEIIRAILRNSQHLGSGIATILSGVNIRNDSYFFDRFLIRSNYRGAAISQTIHAGAVDLEIVGSNALAIRRDLWLVLRLED